MPTTTTPSRTARERTRRAELVEILTEALAGHEVLDLHPVHWGPHSVPWCGGECPGGESWPCPPVAALLTPAQLAGLVL